MERVARLDKSRDNRFAIIFNALSDRSRFNLFKSLVEKNGMCVSETAKRFKVTPSAISQHFRILEMSGLVSKERTGQKVCYELNMNDPIVKSLIKLIN